MAVLYVASIPWYRSAGDETGTLLGLPHWVGVALLCYVAAAFGNAAAWLLTEVPDASEAPETPETPEAPPKDRSP